MATKLRKRVVREVGDLGLRGGDEGEYIVTLYPWGTLSLRRKRKHKEYFISLAECYRQAAKLEARLVASERRRLKQKGV